ncbi:MAG: hypothetical protein PVI90_01205 [Desulfobacteraceae bacterium]
MPKGLKQIVVLTNVNLVKSTVNYKNKAASAALLSQGFGLPNADENVVIISTVKGNILNLKVQVDQEGYFAELKHQFFLTLPSPLKNRINVEIITEKTSY